MYRLVLFFLIAPVFLMGQSEADSIAYSIDLDDFVVTAQYEPTHYKKAIHNVRIIKKETIEKLGAVTLDRLLMTVPTVRVNQDPILGTSISLRGIESSNVAILMDGVPVIGRNGGAIDVSQLSLQNVERIEVIEGPLSNLYGNNAAAGVINIITKTSQADEWDISLGSQLESIGQQNYTGRIGYQKGKVSGGVNGRYFRFDQYPSDSLRLLVTDTIGGEAVSSPKYPFNPKEQYSIGSYLRYQINPNQQLLMKYDNNTELVTDYAIVKRLQFNPYAEDQFYNTTRNDLSLNYKGEFRDHIYASAVISYNQYDRKRDDTRYYLESMTFDSLLRSTDSIKFQQVFGRADFNYTGYKDWTLGFGGSYTRESGEGDRLIEAQDIDSISTAFTEQAAYVDIKYMGLKNLELAFTSRAIIHSAYDNALISSLLLKYQVNEKLSIRSGVAQGYRSPALKELYLEFVDFNHNILGNENLQPERSLDIQAIINYAPSPMLDVSLGSYWTNIRDRISLAEYETLKFRYENIDDYTVFGLQPSMSINHKNLNLSVGGALSFWSVDLAGDLAPSYGSTFDMNTAITYDMPKYDMSILLNHRYIGTEPNYRIDGEELVITNLASYSLLDLSLSKYLLNKKVRCTAGIRNLLDITNLNNTSASGGAHSGGRRRAISPGRSLFFTVAMDI